MSQPLPDSAAEKKWRLVSTIITRAVILSVSFYAFAFAMRVEWNNKNTPGIGYATPLFGPLHLVADGAPENNRDGIIACLILLPMIFAFIIRPHLITGLISLLGIAGWLFLGLIGSTINC